MRLRIAVTGAFALLASAIAAAVLGDAREARLQALLAEIEGAEHRIPFAGVREIEAGGKTIALRVWSAGDGRRRVEPPGGRAFAGLPSALRPRLRPRVQDFGLALRNYDVRVTGRTEVAGRPAEVLEGRPRYPGRPSFRVAADLETRLPLRFEVRREDDVLFRAEFTSLDLAPSFEGVRFPDPKEPSPWLSVRTRAVEPDGLSAAAGFPAWTPGWLPPGFERRGASVVEVRLNLPERTRKALPMAVPDLDSRIVHLEYTDGLAMLAVVEISTASSLWRFVKRYLPAASGSGVTAHRVAGPGGPAYVVDLGETAVLVAGNAAPAELETVVRTLRKADR